MIDSKDLGEVGEFDIRAYLVPDDELTPTTNGVYTDDVIAAWKRGEWHYVTVVVTASRDGVELGSASLGGCEYGDFPGDPERVNPLNGSGGAFCNGYGPGLIKEAVEAAGETLSRISR